MSSLAEPRRPRLLPQNRKLRHLKGVWLRNLCFAPANLRTADDAGLNKSPNKLEVLRESNQLHPSRSSESLRKDSLRPETLRPQKARRTSLSFAHANPEARHKALETLVDEAVGDVFFSLHVQGHHDPVYVSEVRERSANFNFQFFDLGNRGPTTSRSCSMTIRIWAKRPKHPSWIFLVEELIDLRRLNFIGTLMDRRFPPNALVLHLEDGIYSLDFPNRVSDPRQAPSITTSSYNALMKLANLESSIEDAMETQQKIMDEINHILDDSPTDKSLAAKEEVTVAAKYVATQQRTNRYAERKRDELRESIRARKEAITKGREVQRQAEEDIASSREKLQTSKDLLETTEQQIRGQRRRICSDLAAIFPITPIPNAPPLSFQICNVPLPNSTYDAQTAKAVSEDTLSAALGLVTYLTHHLQFYLGHPLPYPLFAYGSRSHARDEISLFADKGAQRRDFPLYLPRGGSTAGMWRFEYGWFLLNKDIEALCASQGLKVVDIRHTLPNLKYLLYVCSAGSDEVPDRKKGGVRGLWAGRFKGRMSALSSLVDDDGSSLGSRRDSNDSEAVHPPHEPPLKTNGGVRDDVAVASPVDDISLPFSEGETKFTLRTKGLRENVSR